MVNYLHRFIPHLADINKPLSELLEKSVEWHWMERQQKAYEELIDSITEAPVLKYFDVSADVTARWMRPRRVLVPVYYKECSQWLMLQEH